MINICKKIRINYSFILLILLSLLSGLFRDIIVFIMIIIIHELGHILLSLYFKWNIEYVKFSICGAFIIYNDDIDKNFYEELILSISGVIFQNIIFSFFYLLNIYNIIDNNLFFIIYKYNISITIFNLLPIIPLDGSKIVYVFLNMRFPYKLSLKILNLISFISILLLSLFLIKNNKLEYSYIMILSFLLNKIYFFLKDIPYKYNRFLFERYKKPISIKKYEYIIGNDLSKMKRQKKHFFKINSKYYDERKLLSKKFD